MTNQRELKPIRTLMALDTSTSALTVALVRDGQVAAERSSKGERNHSIRLLPEIADMLREAGIAPAGLDAVAVGTGPGSYTGVRIGVTVAKTFAWSLGIPVVGVSGLEALAFGIACEHPAADGTGVRWYVPLLDARRGQAYGAVYAADRDGWRTIEPDAIRPFGDWLYRLAQPDRVGGAGENEERPVEIVFCGEVAGFEEAIANWKPPEGLSPDRVTVRPGEVRAACIAELALRRIARGERDDPHRLVPNYTQLAEAEVKLMQKRQQGGEPFGAC